MGNIMETIFDLVYGNYNEEEQIEQYEDIDDLRTDFKYLVENYNYDFVVGRKITIDSDGLEDIDIIFDHQN